MMRRARRYVPSAVQPFLQGPQHEFWSSEMRRVSVMFVNLGFVDEELAQLLDDSFAHRLNRAFRCVQEAVYMYDGGINKFLVDDKGSTLIACFGLPPASHENDSARAVLAGMALLSNLLLDGLHASVGITSGVVFCGVVGHHGGRREYTVLGDPVNLAARLMQLAMKRSCDSSSSDGGGDGSGPQQQIPLVVDKNVRYMSRMHLEYDELTPVKVKGKSHPVQVFSPKVSSITTLHPPGTALPQTQSIGVAHASLELERTIDTMAHWRRHVQSYAGSHSSLNRRTASMLSHALEQQRAQQAAATDECTTPALLPVTKNPQSPKEMRNPLVPSPRVSVEASAFAAAAAAAAAACMPPLERILLACEQHLTTPTPRAASTSSAAAARPASVIVLEGQVGQGKTHVLAKVAIACEEMHATLGHKTVVAVAANPFERGLLSRPYGVWQDVIEALLIDHEVTSAQERILAAQRQWAAQTQGTCIETKTQSASLKTGTRTSGHQEKTPALSSSAPLLTRRASALRGIAHRPSSHRATTLRQMRVFEDIAAQHHAGLKERVDNSAGGGSGGGGKTAYVRASRLPLSPVEVSTQVTSRERTILKWLASSRAETLPPGASEGEAPDKHQGNTPQNAEILDLLFATSFVARQQQAPADNIANDTAGDGATPPMLASTTGPQHLEHMLTLTPLVHQRTVSSDADDGALQEEAAASAANQGYSAAATSNHGSTRRRGHRRRGEADSMDFASGRGSDSALVFAKASVRRVSSIGNVTADASPPPQPSGIAAALARQEWKTTSAGNDPPARSDSLGESQKSLNEETVCGIFASLLGAATRNAPLVILIDDGLELDNKAWQVCCRIAAAVPSVLVVVGMRPMAMHMRRFGAVPSAFAKLMSLKRATVQQPHGKEEVSGGTPVVSHFSLGPNTYQTP